MPFFIAAMAAASLTTTTSSSAQAGFGQSVEISVLTYNVHGLPWPLAKGRGAALRKIGDELARMRSEGRQPTLVLIQEGFRGEIANLVKTSGYPYWARGPARADPPNIPASPAARAFARVRYIASGEGWGKLTSGGLYVLSDLPISDVRRTAYPQCAGWDCLANKGAMLVRVRLDGAPAPIDVVNTHMNAKRSSKVPMARWMMAHKLQTDAFLRFIRDNRGEAPLLVGGDFNVRGSAERYDYQAEARPYAVVSEYCAEQPSRGCGGAPYPATKPWLASEDLQGFAGHGDISVEPEAVKSIFTVGDPVGRLSDHDGYLVRYKITWPSRAATAQGAGRDAAGSETVGRLTSPLAAR